MFNLLYRLHQICYNRILKYIIRIIMILKNIQIKIKIKTAKASKFNNLLLIKAINK